MFDENTKENNIYFHTFKRENSLQELSENDYSSSVSTSLKYRKKGSTNNTDQCVSSD